MYRQLKLNLGIWFYNRYWAESKEIRAESLYCPIMGARRMRHLRRSCQNAVEFADELMLEHSINLANTPVSDVPKRHQLIQNLDKISNSRKTALRNMSVCEQDIKEMDARTLNLTRQFASKQLTFGGLASDYGLSTAKRIRRKALLAGWLWFPGQSFASQGLAEFLMMMLPGRAETLEALCEVNDALYKKEVNKRSPATAVLIYWKCMVVDAWSVCQEKWKWQINIGALVTGGTAVWHWFGPIIDTVKGALHGFGIPIG